LKNHFSPISQQATGATNKPIWLIFTSVKQLQNKRNWVVRAPQRQ